MIEIEKKFIPQKGFAEIESELNRNFTISWENSKLQKDIYFDSKSFSLFRSGLALRVRYAGAKAVLTLKTLESSEKKFSQRQEWDEELESFSPVPNGPLDAQNFSGQTGRILSHLNPRPLLFPLITIENQRKKGRLDLAEQLSLEISLDMAQSKGGPAFREIEIELLQGSKNNFLKFISEIKKLLELKDSSLSKFQRGAKALALKLPKPPLNNVYPPFQKPWKLAEISQIVIGQQFELLLYHEEGTRLGIDPENLHQMRLAVRRLSWALRIFGKLEPRIKNPRLAQKSKWLSRYLGEVRDLDVVMANLKKFQKSGNRKDSDLYNSLQTLMARKREKQRSKLLMVLDSKRFIEIKNNLTQIFSNSASASQEISSSKMAKFFSKEHRKITLRCKKVSLADDSGVYHALRKRLRRERYTAEFFKNLAPVKIVRYQRQLTAIQDILGEYQDGVVLLKLVQDFYNKLSLQNDLGNVKLTAMKKIKTKMEKNLYSKKSQSLRTLRNFSKIKLPQLS